MESFVTYERHDTKKLSEWAKKWLKMRSSRDYKIVYDEKERIAEKRFKENPIVLSKIKH